MWWRTRVLAYLAGGAVGLLVLLGAFLIEVLLLGLMLNRIAPSGSGTVTWDPLSLWRSSVFSKACLLLTVLIPLVVSALAGKCTYGRIVHPSLDSSVPRR